MVLCLGFIFSGISRLIVGGETRVFVFKGGEIVRGLFKRIKGEGKRFWF